MTAAVLIGFFLMLFAPCIFAIYGGREKKAKAIAPSYADRAVNRTPVEEDEELDLPVRVREQALIETSHEVPVEELPTEDVPAPMRAVARRVRNRKPDLEEIVEQAESEALAAHAMAAQANATAMAATARAAQARAEAAAEQAAAASRASADHAAAVREAQRYADATGAAPSEQPISGNSGSRRAA